jgi:hypothetical protein
MNASEKRERQRLVNMARTKQSENVQGQCAVTACARLTRPHSFEERYCRHHVAQFNQNGSAWHKGWTAKELLAHRREARRLWKSAGELRQDRALACYHARLDQGRAIEGFRQGRMKPEDQVRSYWGHLRKKNVKGTEFIIRLLCVHLARQQGGCPRTGDFYEVQLARSVRRLSRQPEKIYSKTIQLALGVRSARMSSRLSANGLRRLGKQCRKIIEWIVD